ncbi:acyltransferase family protein [Pseudarthrobacter sp. TAF60_1]|uniref:acyltransferase family protein n=1 Tax=Pseudarthrobacter sp. TAF60_1 TaxID=3233071 RepID=UPI003F98EEC6
MKPKQSSLRPDIQGLRALAVLLVISDHMLAYPSGGFVGVDVFFVISGFVITSSLLREQARRGRISFADFYRRRARRILPLSMLVLLATVGAGWAIFTTSRAWQITQDGIWSMIFGANWHFALAGTNYMESDGVVSPLQHFWSLAVEEQFYFAWPWLIVLVTGVLASRMGWAQGMALRVLAFVMAAVSVISFGFAIWETAASPTFAYFSTFSRAWELGAGALLAVLSPVMKRLPAAIRPLLAWVGLGGILAGSFIITTQSPFPGPWAALPVVATMLVIAAGTGGSHVGLAPITNPVARYLGDISYSLYLWHFPVIILLGTLVPLAGPMEYLMFFAIILGLSALSYYYLEEPIRHSNWLEPGKRERMTNHSMQGRLAIGGVIAMGIVTAIVVGVALSNTAPAPVSAVTAPRATPGATVAAPATLADAHAATIQAALTTAAWPALSPSVDELGPQAKAPEWANDGCLGMDSKSMDDPVANADRCVYGNPDASRTAVVLGDSMAISYVPGIRAALEPKGYKVVVYTVQQCPAESVTVLKGDKSPHPRCDVFRNWALGSIRGMKPDLVIMTSNHGAPMADGATGAASSAEWAAGAKATFAALAGSATRTVMLTPPPGGKSLDACATRASKPSDCVTGTDRDDERTVAAIKVEAAAANVKLIDATPWFCMSGNCPSFVGTTPVYADGGHLTAKYATALAPLLAEALGA